MKVLLPAAAAAALMVSSAAFAASSTPAAQPAVTPLSGAAKPAQHPVAAVRHHATAALGWGNATTALNLLEAQGYGSFTDFRRDGQDYDATVSQNGKTFQVKVDPGTGQITRS